MKKELELFVSLNKAMFCLSKSFECHLDGLGTTEFIILLYLSEAPNGKMRRMEIANKLGLTASGVTRQLLSMEKIGLVGREPNPTDARSSYVLLESGGRRKLEEAMPYAELFCTERFENLSPKQLVELGAIVRSLA